jgi:hypothetical protein
LADATAGRDSARITLGGGLHQGEDVGHEALLRLGALVEAANAPFHALHLALTMLVAGPGGQVVAANRRFTAVSTEA